MIPFFFSCNSVPWTILSQYRPYRRAIAQDNGPLDPATDFHGRINSQAVVDGGGEVGGAGWIIGGLGGVAVAGAVHHTALDAAAGQDGGEHLAPVIAAITARAGAAHDRLAHTRRPAHLPRPDNQGLIQHAALAQIVEQGGE